MSGLGPGWTLVLVEKGNGAHDEARCAEGALEARFVDHPPCKRKEMVKQLFADAMFDASQKYLGL